jgi:glycerophosphoryl diester phosphodiesterase
MSPVNPAPPWPYPRCVAHRGGGTLAPENTLAAIRVGAEYGYRAVEFDAMLAGDDVPVLMHDETLERTTSGRGPVAALSSAQLARLDAGGWHDARYRGEPVPSLQDAIRLCRSRGLWMNIEIKPAAGAEQRTGAAVARVAAQLFADRLSGTAAAPGGTDPQLPLLSSFSPVALAAARAAAPGLARGLLVDRVPRHWRRQVAELGCVSLHTNHRHLTRGLARAIRDAGVWLFCYTVNEPGRVETLFRWGVDAVCTDRIDLIRPSPPRAD